MIRDSNESQGRKSAKETASEDELRSRFGPRRAPSGTDNFVNLLRDPGLVLGELIAEGLARRGFADLRPALLAVGAHLRESGIRITELAERAQLTKATVVHTVDELERLGYARRVPDPGDGRAKLVVPTERAIAAERAGREVIDEVQAAWAELLGQAEMARLEQSLRRLRTALWPG